MRRLGDWLLANWVLLLICIVAIAGGLAALVPLPVEMDGNASAPCYSPNNFEHQQIMCREIDRELNVVCYWIKNTDDIFCILLNQTNYEEE